MQSTNTVTKVPVVGVIEPRCDLNAKQVYIALKGPKYVSQKNFSTTSYSNSSFQFSCPPPSTQIIVDRQVWVQLQLTAVFSQDVRATSPNGPGLGRSLSLRQWPLTSILDSIQCTINNATISQTQSDYVHALTRYHAMRHSLNKNYSLTASMPDQWQDLATYIDPGVGGFNRNPMGSYGLCPDLQSRGSILPSFVSADGKTLKYTIMEPLMLISPFIWDGEDDHMGFANVNTLDFNLNFKTDLSRMFSIDNSTNVVPLLPPVVSLDQNGGNPSPLMHITFLSPSDLLSIPRTLVYPLYLVDRLVTGGQNLPNGQSVVITSNNKQLDQVPKRCYIFARQRNSDQTVFSSDTFACITNINVSFNNVDGQLSTMNALDLYNMSRRNGLEMSWAQFGGGSVYGAGNNAQSGGFCGSVVAIDFGVDLGLSPTEAPGKSSGQSYNFQAYVTIQNTSNNPAGSINYDLFTIFIYEGTFEVSVGMGIQQSGVLNGRNILDSRDIIIADYNEVKMYGQGVFGKLKSFINKASRVGQVIGKIGKDIASVVAPQYAPYLGALEKVSDVGRKYSGGVYGGMYGGMNGMGLYGGNIDKKEQKREIIEEEQVEPPTQLFRGVTINEEPQQHEEQEDSTSAEIEPENYDTYQEPERMAIKPRKPVEKPLVSILKNKSVKRSSEHLSRKQLKKAMNNDSDSD